MPYFVYVLRSEKEHRFYIGYTGNLIDRLERHNGGRSKSTKNGVPWKLVYLEECISRSEAIKREKQIKSWKIRAKIEESIKID